MFTFLLFCFKQKTSYELRISDLGSAGCSSYLQAIIPLIRVRLIVTYGFSSQADLRGTNVTPCPDGNRFDIVVLDRDGDSRTIPGIHLPMSGRHNEIGRAHV